MPAQVDDLLATFFDEADEHLGALEQGLLQLTDGDSDPAAVNALFRAAHSIKGGSGLFGFLPVTRLTHALEQLLDRMRKGELSPSRERVDQLLRAVDTLRTLLTDTRRGIDTVVPQQLIDELGGGPPASQPAATPTRAAPETRPQGYRVLFQPKPEFLTNGMDPLVLLRNLGRKGSVQSVTPLLDELPSLDALDPTRCHIAWRIDLRTDEDAAEVRNVFQFVADECALEVAPLNPPDPLRRVESAALFAAALDDLLAWVTTRGPRLQLTFR